MSDKEIISMIKNQEIIEIKQRLNCYKIKLQRLKDEIISTEYSIEELEDKLKESEKI